MAHTLDNKTKIPLTANTTINTNPATGTYVCDGSATLLTLAIINAGNTPRGGGSPTYGAQTFLQADTTRGVTECLAELWYILNPITKQVLLISVPNSGGIALDIIVSSYIPQFGYTSVLDVAAGTGSTAANPNVRIVTTADGDVIVGVLADGMNSFAPTFQSGTALYNEDPAAWGGGAQYILQPTAGQAIVAWQATSDDYGVVAAAFKEQLGPVTKSLTDTASATDLDTIAASLSQPEAGSGTDEIYPRQPSVAHRSSAWGGMAQGNSGDNLTNNLPYTADIDDIILVFVSYKYTGDVTLWGDGGYIEIAEAAVVNTNTSPNLHGRVFWKRATADDLITGFVGFYFSSVVTEANLIITVHSGASKNNFPFVRVSTTSGNGNCTLPSITTLTNNDSIIGFVGNKSFSTWSSSDLIERGDYHTVASYSSLQINAGASGTKLITSSVTDEYVGIILNLSTEAEIIAKSLTDTGTGADSVSKSEAGAGTIAISTAAYKVFLRNGNVGNIIVSGTYTGSPLAIEASFNGGAYSTIDGSPSSGRFAGTLTSQPEGQGTLTVRFTNNVNVNASVSYIGIGENFLIAGQSNAVGYTSANQTYSHAYLKACMFGNDYVHKELADPVDSNVNQVDAVSLDASYGGSCWPPLATLFMADQNVPIAFIPCALSDTSITQWLPGADHFDRTTLYGSMAYRALQTNARCILWWQGETDVMNGMSEADYNGYLDTIANAIGADLGIKLMPCKLQDAASWYQGFDETAINNAIGTAWADNPNVVAGPDFHLIDFGALHYDNTEAVDPVAPYWWGAIRAAFFSNPVSVDDTALGTDAKPISSASLSVTDSGLGTDEISILGILKYVADVVLRFAGIVKSVTDTGTISEATSISAGLSLLDSATSIERLSELASLTLSELGIGVDSSQLAALLGITDSAGIIDFLNSSAALTLSDTGTIAEVLGLIASLQLVENGLGTDGIANLLASLSVIDTGLGTDTLFILSSFLKVVSDSGSGSDAVANLIASLSVGEAATITEALLQAVSLYLSENGIGADGTSLAASLFASDVGIGAESSALSALDSIIESGRGSDTLSGLASALGVSEGGSANDLLNLLASLSLIDSGSGSDTINVLTATLKSIQDVASGIDGVSIQASLSLVDNGYGQDNLSIQVSLTIRDTGIGTDAISLVTQTIKSIFDTVLGSDRISISASLNLPEFAYGIDTPTIAASITGYDISITSDSPIIQASLTLTDLGSASDALSILQTAIKLVQDLGSGSDFVGNISASIPVAELGLGTDQIGQLLASLLVTDFGTGVEVVIALDVTTQIIKISFIIKKSAIAFALSCPTIEFVLSCGKVEYSFVDGG